MISITKILKAIVILLFPIIGFSQIKNESTEVKKIYGNCEMCKATIEKAGNLNKVAAINWNKDTKLATIQFDSKKTNIQEILKRIALAGYDSDTFLAPDQAYSKLPGCCKYERSAKILPVEKQIVQESQKIEIVKGETSNINEQSGQIMPSDTLKETPLIGKNTPKAEEHSDHNMPAQTQKATPIIAKEKPKAEKNATSDLKKETDQMQPVFNAYFKVKDAMVNTDSKATAAKATELVTALNAIKMNDLPMDVHMVWMKVMKELNADAKKIVASKKMDEQRKALIPLTKNIYALMKVAKSETPTYYQFCPMANGGKGANWLSKENEVRNPYYGSEMMNCGKVVETIK